MKLRIAAITLCSVLVLSLAACGAEKPGTDTDTTAPASTTEVKTEAAQKAEVSFGVTSAFVIDESNYQSKMIPEEYKGDCFGVYVSNADVGSDLLRSGFRRGDIIHAIDGTDILSIEDVKTALLKYKVGDTVTVSVFRYDILKKTGSAFETQVTFTDPTKANTTASNSGGSDTTACNTATSAVGEGVTV